MEHKKITITPTTITIGDMKGHILPKNYDYSFLHEICKIDTSQYDSIYHLDNTFAGGYFFISDNGTKYRLIICGSGIPIVSDRSGILRKINKKMN